MISWQAIYFDFFGTLLVCQVIISWQTIYFNFFGTLHVCQVPVMISWQTIYFNFFGTLHVCQVMISWQTTGIYFNFLGTLHVCQVMISWQTIYFNFFGTLHVCQVMISWHRLSTFPVSVPVRLVSMRIRIRHFRSVLIRIQFRIRIQGFGEQKLKNFTLYKILYLISFISTFFSFTFYNKFDETYQYVFPRKKAYYLKRLCFF